MRVLAIDPATRSGWAIGEPGQTPRLAFVDFRADETDEHWDICARAAVWLIRLIAREQPELLAIEELIPRRDQRLQAGLWGVLTGIAAAKGVRIMVAPIGTWRLYALGSGRLRGEVAKARAVELCRLLGWNVPHARLSGESLDAAEAGCIWLWACSRVAPKLVPRHEPLFVARGGRR